MYKQLLSPLPSIVSVNYQFCSFRKLKKRRSRNLPGGGGGPSRRACPSLCLSAFLKMDKKMIRGRPGMGFGVRQSSPAAHQPRWEKVLRVAEALWHLQRRPCRHSPARDSCGTQRRGSPKARARRSKVCKAKSSTCRTTEVLAVLLMTSV